MLPRQEVPQPPAIHSTLPLNPAYLSHLRPSMSSGSTGRGLAADTFVFFVFFFFNSTCCLSFHPHFMGPSTALHIPRWMWVFPKHSWSGTVVGRSVGGNLPPTWCAGKVHPRSQSGLIGLRFDGFCSIRQAGPLSGSKGILLKPGGRSRQGDWSG